MKVVRRVWSVTIQLQTGGKRFEIYPMPARLLQRLYQMGRSLLLVGSVP